MNITSWLSQKIWSSDSWQWFHLGVCVWHCVQSFVIYFGDIYLYPVACWALRIWGWIRHDSTLKEQSVSYGSWLNKLGIQLHQCDQVLRQARSRPWGGGPPHPACAQSEKVPGGKGNLSWRFDCGSAIESNVGREEVWKRDGMESRYAPKHQVSWSSSVAKMPLS